MSNGCKSWGTRSEEAVRIAPSVVLWVLFLGFLVWDAIEPSHVLAEESPDEVVIGAVIPLTGQEIRDFLDSGVTVDGIMGPIRFDGARNIANKRMQILRVYEGKREAMLPL